MRVAPFAMTKSASSAIPVEGFSDVYGNGA
jgi:hypothetical protein